MASWSWSRSRTARRCRSSPRSRCGPYNPEGLAVVERIGLVDRTVTVDGRPALLFPKPPARLAGIDVPRRRLRAHGRRRPGRHRVPRAAAVRGGPGAGGLPLSGAAPRHAAGRDPDRARAAHPPPGPGPPPRRAPARAARRRCPRRPRWPRAGRRRRRRGLRLELPDARLAEAVEANRRYLLLLHDGDDHHAGPGHLPPLLVPRRRLPARRARPLRLPRARSSEVLRSYPGRQHVDGFFFSQRQEWDANGAALWTHGGALAARLATESLARADRAGGRTRRALDRAQAPIARAAGATPSCAACCPPASRPSTSARSTTSTGTTSGRSRVCVDGGRAARRRRATRPARPRPGGGPPPCAPTSTRRSR